MDVHIGFLVMWRRIFHRRIQLHQVQVGADEISTLILLSLLEIPGGFFMGLFQKWIE